MTNSEDQKGPNQDRITELYGRYTNATASRAELEEFLKLSADPANEPVFQSLMSGSWEELQAKGEDLRILREESVPVRHINRHRFSARWAVAVSVLLLAGITSFFFLNKKAPAFIPIAQTQMAPDIAPGTNKAILYLANGQRITLDSAHTGHLATLGTVIVTKTDSGKLTFASASNTKNTSAELNGINILQTPRGGIYTVVLPDGTTAWLNAESKLTYPTRFTGPHREVKITGEVYFEVAHDATHPFIVSILPTANRQLPTDENLPTANRQPPTNDWMQVRVLGTHFNINAYPEEPVLTTLLEGSVRITTSKEATKIKPGQQASTEFSHPSIAVNDNVDLEKVMAWKNGEMVMTNGTVEQLMREISRWYDVDIKYAGTVPDKKFFGSVNRNVPLSSVLKVLKAYGIETTLDETNKLLIVK